MYLREIVICQCIYARS